MYQGEVHIGQEQLKEFLRAAQLLQVRGLTDVPAPAPMTTLDQKASPVRLRASCFFYLQSHAGHQCNVFVPFWAPNLLNMVLHKPCENVPNWAHKPIEAEIVYQ